MAIIRIKQVETASLVPSSSWAATASYIDVTGSNIMVRWSGSLLQLTGSSAVSVGQDPPVSYEQGSLWWDTDDANLYIYYQYVSESVSQSAWVSATALDIQNATAVSASYAVSASHVNVTGSNVYVKWEGDLLQLTGSGNVDIGGMPPTDASEGHLWWDSDEGNLYVYYFDGVNYQWVPATALSVENTTVGHAVSASLAATASYMDIVGKGIAVNRYGAQTQLTSSAADPFPYTGSVIISGSVEVQGSTTSNELLIGDGNDGSFRLILSGSDLFIEKKVSGNWNYSGQFTA